MPETAPSQVAGRVVESLPGALYRVELMTESHPQVTAHVSGTSSLLRLLVGDSVVVELMPYDPGRARILRRQG